MEDNMKKIKHWFFHFIAVCYLVIISPHYYLKDWEWEWYQEFMKRHGFNGLP